MSSHSSPVQSTERAPTLDVMRGLALLGIFLNNIYAFSGYGFLEETDKQKFLTFQVDRIADFLQTTLVEGKFYSLFSLLFGIGFSIYLTRGEQEGKSMLRLFYRRLGILFLMGAVHLFLLWEGDILLLYAVLGFFLLLFRNCADKSLLLWAATLILSPIVIDLVKIGLQASPTPFLQSIGFAMMPKTALPGKTGAPFYLPKTVDGKSGVPGRRAAGFFAFIT